MCTTALGFSDPLLYFISLTAVCAQTNRKKGSFDKATVAKQIGHTAFMWLV